MSRYGLFKTVGIGFQSALQEIRSQKFRTLVSLAGIALSMGTTTSMVCFLRGTEVFLKQLVSEMGSAGTVRMVAKSPGTDQELAMSGRSRGLRISDADSLLQTRPWGATPYRTVEAYLPVLFRSTKEILRVKGVDRLSMEEGERILNAEGSFFSEREYMSGDRVCVIGWKLAEEARKPMRQEGVGVIGRSILIAGQGYRIIGVFAKSHMQWEPPGYFIYLPLASMLKDFSGQDPALSQISIRFPALDSQPRLADSLSGYFRRLHRGVEDVVFGSLDNLGEIKAMMRNLKLTFWAIIAISVSICCANIINLMLSTLSERIVEIGIRKSIGATGPEVFSQFLVESLSLCILGGTIGSMLGLAPLAFANGIEAATGGIRPQADFRAFLIILCLILAMGLVSGIYPAFKAGRLDPIDALRHA